jgi:hypothetical protein
MKVLVQIPIMIRIVIKLFLLNFYILINTYIKMELVYILYIYIVVVIAIIFILCKISYSPWSAIALALIIGQVLLLILYQPQYLENESGSTYALYILIQFGTVFYVFIYTIIHASKNFTNGSIKHNVNVISPVKHINITVDH